MSFLDTTTKVKTEELSEKVQNTIAYHERVAENIGGLRLNNDGGENHWVENLIKDLRRRFDERGLYDVIILDKVYPYEYVNVRFMKPNEASTIGIVPTITNGERGFTKDRVNLFWQLLYTLLEDREFVQRLDHLAIPAMLEEDDPIFNSSKLLDSIELSRSGDQILYLLIMAPSYILSRLTHTLTSLYELERGLKLAGEHVDVNVVQYLDIDTFHERELYFQSLEAGPSSTH